LYALLEEGKIQETEGPGSGKFEPTEKLNPGVVQEAYPKDEAIPPKKWETLKNENPDLHKSLSIRAWRARKTKNVKIDE
jgi:hypothetical protein